MNSLETVLAKMVDQTCWSMIGPSAGSMFSLDFGDKQKRKILIKNDKLREEQRNFTGEYRLLAWMTGWHLLHDSKRICDCNDSNENEGAMAMGLRQLEGKKMLRFEFGKSPAELMIAFSKGYHLFLTDWEGTKPEDKGYMIYGDGLTITVRMNGKVSEEPSQRDA